MSSVDDTIMCARVTEDAYVRREFMMIWQLWYCIMKSVTVLLGFFKIVFHSMKSIGKKRSCWKKGLGAD